MEQILPSQQLSSQQSKLQRRLLVAITIAFLPAIIFSGAWRLGGVSAIGDDLIYYYPVREFIGEHIRNGELPLWNPYTLMGTSMASDPQSGLWYPTTYLFALLAPDRAYPISILLHFILAGAGMYRFLRSSRYDWRAAFLGALAFEFSGYLLAHRSHLTIHQAAAWIPWIFYAWRRFADTGRSHYFTLASACFGLQLLVQHIQPSIIMAALLTAYVLVVLWPHRRSLWWEYPAGMTLGAMLAAVQLFPTYFQFAASGRGTAAYYLFIENSWVLTSAMMFLFPLLFGIATPTSVWPQPWWGISHFCEQWAYPTIVILLLALASSALIKSYLPPFNKGGPAGVGDRRDTLVGKSSFNREIVFWWVACFVALIFAVGDLTPVSKWMFHVPIYRNLRVPARWIIVWSLAMPTLAAAAMSAIIRSQEHAQLLGRRIRWLGTRALPIAAFICLSMVIVARLLADKITGLIPSQYAQPNWNSIKSAVRLENPAMWWPLIMMTLSAICLVHWSRTRSRPMLLAVFAIYLIDLVSIAAFIDVDNGTYKLADLKTSPLLTQTIRDLDARPGDRVLVPRFSASYHRPLEILWPLSNLRDRIPTLNGYGPLWSTANRLVFRFMAWGSSEEIVGLLRNVPLLQAMGTRFIVTRSEEERAMMNMALAPALAKPEIKSIAGTEAMTAVPWSNGLLWPIHIETPGLYQLEFDAEPVVGSPSRWFVRLETTEGVEIDYTRCIDPVDLSLGPRRFRFLFNCETAPGAALVRIKSEMGQALSAAKGTFGCVSKAAPTSSDALITSPIRHKKDLPGDITLYEVPGSADLIWLAKKVETVETLGVAVDRLVRWPNDMAWDHHALLQAAIKTDTGFDGRGQVSYNRPRNHELQIESVSQSEQLLVFNESYDGGWRATIDDQAAPIHRVNALCQGVIVPAGRHVIAFQYWPSGLSAGITVTFGALLAINLISIAGWISRRKSPAASYPQPKPTPNFIPTAL